MPPACPRAAGARRALDFHPNSCPARPDGNTLENQVVQPLPPAQHPALRLEAIDMGCHVFVEKPMAETVADCDRMIARAREKGLVVSVNHSARMDPIVLQALDLLKQGVCGEITGADFFRSSD